MGSSHWVARFTLPDGKRTQRSTRIPVRGKDAREAQSKAHQFETIARGKMQAAQIHAIVADLNPGQPTQHE